jgi:hypothetical protein
MLLRSYERKYERKTAIHIRMAVFNVPQKKLKTTKRFTSNNTIRWLAPLSLGVSLTLHKTGGTTNGSN